jgi:hypothetical protein
MDELFFRRVPPTHLLCLEAHVDTLVALGVIFSKAPVRECVCVIDLLPEGWLAASSPFGREVVAHLAGVLNRVGASALLFAPRSLAQEELGRTAELPLVRIPELPMTIPLKRRPPTELMTQNQSLNNRVRFLADLLGFYAEGFSDPIRFAIIMEAVARRLDLPMEWRRELADAENRWLSSVKLDPTPTPFHTIPDLVACLQSLGFIDSPVNAKLALSIATLAKYRKR